MALSNTRIRKVEDLWSLQKIAFEITPSNTTSNTAAVLEEITFRTIKTYLERPGHVLLPDNMISPEDIAAARDDPLLRANLLLGYWHGSKDLPRKQYYMVRKTPAHVCQTQQLPILPCWHPNR